MGELGIVGPDLVRTLVIVWGGVALGFAVAEIITTVRLWLRQRSSRRIGIVLIRTGTSFAICALETLMVTRIGSGTLTWRTPAAALIYTLWIAGMFLIQRDDVRRGRAGARTPPDRD